jgi:GMP reductase
LAALPAGIHKHYAVEDWQEWSQGREDILKYIAVSSGTSDADFAKVNAILDVVDVPFICLDVANGYSEHVSAWMQSCCNSRSL